MQPQTFGSLLSATDITPYYGFVYRITLSSGLAYVGQKSFSKGTNWKTYLSSSTIIKSAIKEGDIPSFEILKLCKTKRELTYQEVKCQFIFGVLESDQYANKNILGKFYKII